MRMGMFTSLLAGVTGATAQTLQIPRSTVASGGGQAVGGLFTLTGTAGQTVTGLMSGDGFALSGGFWPTAGLVPAAAPSLTIRRGTGNTVLLSWPNPSTGYLLQQSSSPAAPGTGWADVVSPPVVAGGIQEVTTPASGTSSLFRLRHP